jgi:hypothetical protein
MKFFSMLMACMVMLLIHPELYSQGKAPIKFGKIDPSDFNLSKHSFDTSAGAVIIADVGSSYFEGNNSGSFNLVFKHQRRIKILSKNGFDAATVNISVYVDGDGEEKLLNLKAYTYNLENGKVVESKLDGDQVFKEKVNKNRLSRKFTFPAVKEGSIIEYSYTINSDFIFNLRAWDFQGSYPRIWSEYEVKLPQFYNYVTLSQGYHPFEKQTKESLETFSVSYDRGVGATGRASFSAPVFLTRWVMKDVPPLKPEAFTSTLENHISKIEFQLSQIRFPEQPVRDIMGNWVKVADNLLKRDDFGLTLSRGNNWLDDDLKQITEGASSQLEKANRIYAYVRDNFTCTRHSGILLTSSLRNVFKARSGTVADINLLLHAMLLHEGIQSAPVILSTRERGYTHEFYPLMDKFNYVLTESVINDKTYYLDASHRELGFGRLMNECYNGHARVITEQPRPIYLVADSLMEKKITSVIMMNDDKEGLTGKLQSLLGYYESLSVRDNVKSKGEKAFFEKIKSAYSYEMNLQQPGIDSLKKPEYPVVVHYDFKTNFEEDIIYFNPMMAEGYKENLLKAAERKYPVEMPYAFDETFILNMEVPKDYAVDEVPKSAKVLFNENEGLFEYLISADADRIQLRSRVVLKKAYFLPEEYESLRDFFAYVVKKHGEQIVLKKKKA